MAANSQTTFSGAFSWMKTSEFWIKFHWNVPYGLNDNVAALAQIMTWRLQADKPLSEPKINSEPKVNSLTHIYAILCLNELILLHWYWSNHTFFLEAVKQIGKFITWITRTSLESPKKNDCYVNQPTTVGHHYNTLQYRILHIALQLSVTEAAHKSEFKLTYLAHEGKIWGVYWGKFE